MGVVDKTVIPQAVQLKGHQRRTYWCGPYDRNTSLILGGIGLMGDVATAGVLAGVGACRRLCSGSRCDARRRYWYVGRRGKRCDAYRTDPSLDQQIAAAKNAE